MFLVRWFRRLWSWMGTGRGLVLMLGAWLGVGSGSAAPGGSLLEARRVVFLGDSITYGGEWVEFVETFVRLHHPEARVEFIALGLPSETVSGLSEPGHAGGAFPRPNLHERLGRVLAMTQPDWVVACYGMNDGIYHPYSEARAKAFEDGLRSLREQAAFAGAQVLHVTPPVFDPVPLAGRTLPAGRTSYPSPYEGYNDVLDRYAEWMVARRVDGWLVVDAHGPMNRFLAERRRTDPAFLLAGDGVHANSQGHWLIAREVVRHLGAPQGMVEADSPAVLVGSHPRGAEVLKLVQERQRLMKDPWLTRVGHVRPGMGTGRPWDEVWVEARVIEGRIRELTGMPDR